MTTFSFDDVQFELICEMEFDACKAFPAKQWPETKTLDVDIPLPMMIQYPPIPQTHRGHDSHYKLGLVKLYYESCIAVDKQNAENYHKWLLMISRGRKKQRTVP